MKLFYAIFALGLLTLATLAVAARVTSFDCGNCSTTDDIAIGAFAISAAVFAVSSAAGFIRLCWHSVRALTARGEDSEHGESGGDYW